jgi:hypothetical protein
LKEIPTSTTGLHFSRISTADKGTGQSRISSAGQESKGTLAGLVLQSKEQDKAELALPVKNQKGL